MRVINNTRYLYVCLVIQFDTVINTLTANYIQIKILKRGAFRGSLPDAGIFLHPPRTGAYDHSPAVF